MIHREPWLVRLLILIFGGVLLATAYLVVRINPDEVGIMYLVLLATAAVVGLLTNLWGGLAASVIASFAIIIIDQYIGIYPKENLVLNISSELVGFLLVGPLTGGIRMLLDRMRTKSEQWVRLAEGRAIHDEHFGTLKPRWVSFRLEEEMLRAQKFLRPFSIAVLELECLDEAVKKDRQAALHALIRLTRAVAQPPSVVSYIGNDQLLVILPEHNPADAQARLAQLSQRVERELYYPEHEQVRASPEIGKPLGTWGRLRSQVVGLDGQSSAAEMIEQARQNLSQNGHNSV